MPPRSNRAVLAVTITAALIACDSRSRMLAESSRSAAGLSASAPDARRSSLDVAPGSPIADGRQSVSLTVRLRDAQGRNVRGYAVELAATGSGNVFQPAATGRTDDSGIFSARLLSTSAGTKTVSAKTASLTLTGTVRFQPGPPAAATSTFSATPLRVANEGHSTATLAAVLRDAHGNPVSGVPVLMTISGSSNVTVPAVPAGLTGANGAFTVSLSSTAAGTKSVTVFAPGFTMHGSVEFAPDAISAWLSTVDTGDKAVVANGHGRAPVVVTLRDGLGRPVPNQPFTLRASGSNNAFAAPAAPGVAPASRTALSARSRTAMLAAPAQPQAASAAPAPVTDGSGTMTTSLASLTPETKTVSATASGVTIATPATFVSPPWVALTAGLTGGWVGRLVVQPDGSLLASTGTGPFRSSDGRAPWVHADGGFAMTSVRLFSDPATASVYALDLEALYRSDDSGITWVPLVYPNLRDFVVELSFDQLDPQVVYGTGLYAVYRSTDGGLNWSELITPTGVNPSDPVNFDSFAIDPFQPATFYLGTDDAVYVSTDAGGTWTQAPGFTASVTGMFPDPRLPGRIFAATRTGISVSTDRGATWSLLYGGADESTLVATIVPDRADLDRIWLGPSGVQQGVAALSVSTGAVTQIGPAGIDAYYINDAGGRLFASGGDSSHVNLYVSDDRGTTWSALQDGIAQMYASSVAVDPHNPQVVYAAVNGVMKSTDEGDTWVPASDSALAGSVVFQLLLVDSSTLYASGTAGTYRSTDGAATWTLIDGRWLDLALDALDPHGLYARAPFGDLLHSSDSGTSWTFLSHPEPDGWSGGFVASPAEPRILYYLERDLVGDPREVLLRSQDGGATWTEVNSSLPLYAFVVADPATPGVFYMLQELGGPLFRSTDGGASFAALGDPPWGTPYVGTLLIDPKAPGTIWVGVGGQLFRSRDGGTTWVEADTGMAGASVLSLAFHPTDSDTLFAGTYGNGVLRTRSGGVLSGVVQ